jgi:tetratricopeptide (TPR) repeat protein
MIAIGLLVACSKTKDTFTSRLYHEMVSAFNPLFNGEQALLKAKQSLEQSHEEDYNQLLPVFLVGDEQSASAIKPDLEKAIEKGSKVISQHSMLIKNRQKNDLIDDSYMLVGKARFYDRDYLKALETFNYVIQEFSSNAEARLEAELWAARTETALENYITARQRFERIYRDEDLPKKLKDDVYAAYAQLEIDRGRYSNAYQLISQAIDKSKEKEQKRRWLFIAAQLQTRLGNDYDASLLYKEVIKLNPPYEMLFNAQLARARVYDVDLQDPENVYDELRDMLKDEKNFDNRDKIYYVMAQVAEKLDDPERVVEYLNKSIRVSTQNAEQKALSYLWLAEINFEEKQYLDAQAYYDSTFSNLPKDHPRYDRVKALKESLGKLVENLNTIRLQDSLQNLAGMSEKQRLAVAQKIIDQIKEEEAQKELERQRQEMAQLAFNTGNSSSALGGIAGSGSANKDFYFYNPTLRSTGVSAFAQRWGNRKLEDNWRRKNKATNAGNSGSSSANNASAQGDNASAKEDPRFDPETYLQNIPETEEELAASDEKIQNALLDNALLYKEEILDLFAAASSLKEILERYPQYENKAKVWYILYRIYKVQEDPNETQRYKKLILDNYPNSEFAYLIRNEGKEKKEVDASLVKELYVEAYQAYEAKRYRESETKAEKGFKNYPESEYGPRFLLLQALSRGYLKDEKAFADLLQQVVARYPNTEAATKASAILKKIDPKSQPGQQNPENQEEPSVQYRKNFSAMHRYVVLFPNQKASANQITIKLTDFNKKYYPNDPLRAKSFLMGGEYQLITVSGLPNRGRALQYLKTLKNQKTLEAELLSVDYKQFVISNPNFSEFYTQKDTEGYMKFFKENYK